MLVKAAKCYNILCVIICGREIGGHNESIKWQGPYSSISSYDFYIP